MSEITFRVNGTTRTVDIDPATPLLYVLRNDFELQGPRFGCGLGQCGACTVIIRGAAVRSCITAASAVQGAVLGLLIWVGVSATSGAAKNAACDKPLSAYLIDCGHELAALVVMGVIIGAWR